jgi:hypothetical protein
VLPRPWSYGSWIYNYLCNQCLTPLMLWVRILIRARCTTSCDKVSQWLTTGRWFSPGPPVSSTNETDRHDITEILLKVALKPSNKQNKNDWKARSVFPLKYGIIEKHFDISFLLRTDQYCIFWQDMHVLHIVKKKPDI